MSDQTARDVIFTSVGGDRVRVRLTNSFGTQPLQVGGASIAIAQAGAQARAGTLRALTFGRAPGVTHLEPGAEALSDPVSMTVPALRDVLVSVFVPGASGPAMEPFDAQQDNFISTPGDFTRATSPAAFTPTVTGCSLLVDGVSVVAGDRVGQAPSSPSATPSRTAPPRR